MKSMVAVPLSMALCALLVLRHPTDAAGRQRRAVLLFAVTVLALLVVLLEWIGAPNRGDWNELPSMIYGIWFSGMGILNPSHWLAWTRSSEATPRDLRFGPEWRALLIACGLGIVAYTAHRLHQRHDALAWCNREHAQAALTESRSLTEDQLYRETDNLVPDPSLQWSNRFHPPKKPFTCWALRNGY